MKSPGGGRHRLQLGRSFSCIPISGGGDLLELDCGVRSAPAPLSAGPVGRSIRKSGGAGLRQFFPALRFWRFWRANCHCCFRLRGRHQGDDVAPNASARSSTMARELSKRHRRKFTVTGTLFCMAKATPTMATAISQ